MANANNWGRGARPIERHFEVRSNGQGWRVYDTQARQWVGNTFEDKLTAIGTARNLEERTRKNGR